MGTIWSCIAIRERLAINLQNFTLSKRLKGKRTLLKLLRSWQHVHLTSFPELSQTGLASPNPVFIHPVTIHFYESLPHYATHDLPVREKTYLPTRCDVVGCFVEWLVKRPPGWDEIRFHSRRCNGKGRTAKQSSQPSVTAPDLAKGPFENDA